MIEQTIILDVKPQTFFERFWVKCVFVNMSMFSFMLILS